MDVVTAFLNPEVDDPDLLMEIPEGWDGGNVCYTSGIDTHEGTGKATAEALLRSIPHNGTHLYGITIEYVVSRTCYHPVHKCDA